MTTAPSAPVERVIFSQAVEAFYERALAGRVTADLRERLKSLGFELDRPLLPAYPFIAWVKGLEVTAAVLHPELSRTEAFFELGKRLVVSYEETFIGKALFTTLRLFPARRVIDRMSRNFRTSNNFTEVTVADVEPNVVELTFNVVESDPAFTQGILAAGFPAAGVSNSLVSLKSFDASTQGAVFRVSWS